MKRRLGPSLNARKRLGHWIKVLPCARCVKFPFSLAILYLAAFVFGGAIGSVFDGDI